MFYYVKVTYLGRVSYIYGMDEVVNLFPGSAADLRFTYASNISERSKICKKQLPDINTVKDNRIVKIPFYKSQDPSLNKPDKKYYAVFKKKYGQLKTGWQWFWYFKGETVAKEYEHTITLKGDFSPKIYKG